MAPRFNQRRYSDMKRLFHLSLLIVAAPALSLAAAQFKIGAHNFTLPDGFEIELVAGTNLVPRPIEADFDEQGRLYVTDSSGSNDKPDKQLIDKPHRIVRLEDTDGDGRFDKSIVFADKMMLPEGCLWLDGSLYVAAPPSIWKLTDTNNDGVADVRVEWFQGKTLTGCANDLHGPYAGPDGWIYWCKGAFAKQTYTLPNGQEFTTRASHIFRARPDGTGVEPVMTGGMDNPVGLAFTEEGDRILSGTFFQNPEGGKRDGLIHALYGGVYGKPNDALEGHPRTGELLPITTHLGPAAPAGLMRYESAVFGTGFQNNLFVACFNLHKVVRCVPEPDGATFKTRDSDFLVSDNPDFHPTDVLEDADGSLLVIDTGGWYKLCCPTSQLDKPDVLGGLYRIRRTGAAKVSDPRGLKLSWNKLAPSQLLPLLDDERPPVRQRTVREMAARGLHAAELYERALKAPGPRETRRQLVWTLTRIDSPAARRLVRIALRDRDESIRHVALYSAALWRDQASMLVLFDMLRSNSPGERSAAAAAIGRIGYKGAVEKLLDDAARPTDRALEHALIYALIEIAEPFRTAAGLNSASPSVQRTALIALDQMPRGGLKPEQVTPLLTSTNTSLRETAWWIVSHHAEWADSLAGHFAQRLARPGAPDTADLQRQLGQFISRAPVQKIVAAAVRDNATPKPNRLIALRVMAGTHFKETPPLWGEAIAPLFRGADADLQLESVRVAQALPQHSTNITRALADLTTSETTLVGLRLLAFAARRDLTRLDQPGFEFLRAQLAPTNSVTTRITAAGLLVGHLDDAQLSTLTASVTNAGPMELPKLIAAYNRCTNEAVGLALLEALKTSKAASSLRAEQLRPQLTNFPNVVRQQGDELLASFHTDTAGQKAHLDALLASTKGGDIRRGQALFNSPKVACASCHAIGYLGGHVGPDLTKIGQIRNERDLLEAIVYPNASFVRSYEPMIVATKGGEEFSGVLRKDSPEEVVLATGPSAEQHIPRGDISDMRPGAVSVMPSGLAEQLTKEELADLLAFLKATRW